LRELFPKLSIVEIPAGLPGTGSDLGACRLGYDVLRHRPDLIFVEFAVNDAATPPEQIERTMEGIVRQVWRADPHTDLCFVYTVSAPGLPDLEAGRFPPAAHAMEAVADRYGIPSIHFGVEVARRVAASSLVFKAPAAPDDARTFSLDGVHPSAAGHRLYFDVLKRSLPPLLTAATPRPAALPSPLRADNWEGARLRLIDETMRRETWTPVVPDDPNLRGATKSLLPPTWRAADAGAAVELKFNGNKLGLLGIAAPDSGEFRVTVDDLAPVTGTFFDAYVSPTFCRQRTWFYPGEFAAGPHRMRVELLGTVLDKAGIKAKAGKPADDLSPYAAHRLTLCGILTVGPASP
jgi:lysophospholipase L1-like esterase